MLNRLDAHNYKSLTNFAIEFNRLHLIVGNNGTGKSAVLEILGGLRSLITEFAPIESVFGTSTLTRWDTGNRQDFKLYVTLDSAQYAYSLAVEHDIERQLSKISEERLGVSDWALIHFDGQETHLFRDNGSAGPVYTSDWSRSSVANVQARSDNKRLTRFKDWMSRLITVQMNPFAMGSLTEQESSRLEADMSNVASWYRFQTQESPDKLHLFFASLGDVMPAFKVARLAQYGETVRELVVRFADTLAPPGEYELRFSEFSHGQRALFGLYALCMFGMKSGSTVVIDEPESFVALRDIQPLLGILYDLVYDNDAQAVLISHSRDVINYLGLDSVSYLVRNGGGPTRVERIPLAGEIAVESADLVARDP